MTYKELRERQQKEVNEFPFIFAFDKKQFADAMKNKFGLDPETDTDKIYSIGAGGFIRVEDADRMKEMFERQRAELKAAIDADETGQGFIKDMFLYELRNHEYCYTGDYRETLEALELTADEVLNDPRLLAGLNAAAKIAAHEDE